MNDDFLYGLRRQPPPAFAGELRDRLNRQAGDNQPGDLRFLLPEEKANLKTVLGGAGLSHIAFAMLLLFVVWLRPDRQIQAELPDFPLQDIVFIEQAGPGGGGGGGGNKSPDPPKTQPTPAIKPPEPEPVPVPTPEPVPPPEPVVAAEVPAISPVTTVATLSSNTNTAPASLGTGSNTGAGTGTGGGVGPGSGDGLGPGRGGGTGGDVYQPGSGIDNPTLLFRAQPSYTSDAMMRRIQGEVWLDCVVLATGSVGKCDIVKSLDSDQFGLDTEAVKAAKRFRFKPGTRKGEPVAVLVRIELVFNIR